MSVERLRELRRQLEELLAGFDPLVCTGEAAKAYVKEFAAVERLVSAGKTLALSQVQRTGAWGTDGRAVRSPAEWLAATTGVPQGEAAREVETARRVGRLPATEEALRQGRLSAAQAHQITAAAVEAPAAEADLLTLAQSSPYATLRDEAARVKAAAADESQRAARQRRLRGARRWTDAEGMRRYAVALTPEQAATFEPVWDACHHQVFDTARRNGTRESPEAYAADALVVMAEHALINTNNGRGDDGNGKATGTGGNGRSGGSGLSARLLALIDVTALRRGHTIAGETCEIAGIGPIDVAAARKMLGDATIDIVIREGIDVRTVVPVGRNPTSRQRAALLADWQCEVRGCASSRNLEIDHLVPWSQGGPTLLDNLGPKCGFHHHLKTHEGWTDGPKGEDGKRDLHPPDHPERPDPPDDPDPP